mgnify:FL=1
MQKQRSSNLELLRIISMFLIVMHHYAVHGGFQLLEKDLSLNKIIIQILSGGGQLGVNLFILISGYFLIDSEFKINKLLKLIFETFFYSVIILLFIVSKSNLNIGIKDIIISCLPITYSSYWFITCYVVLYLFIDYINPVIKGLDKKKYFQLILLLLLLLLLWCIIPSFTLGKPGYSPFVWFVLIYLVAGYIKLYPCKFMSNFKVNFILGILFYLIVLFSFIIFDYLGIPDAFFGKGATHFAQTNSIFIFLSSIFLFLAFKNIKMKNYKLLNIISSTTFGIYLIHDNFLMREFIWIKYFKVYEHFEEANLLFYSLKIIVLVFIICSFLDFIRQKLFVFSVDKIIPIIEVKIKNILLFIDKISVKIIKN